MALSDPVINFGIHQLTPYVKSTGVPYGTYRVTGSASMASTAENVKLFGGSQRFPWAVETTNFNSEFTFTLREFPSSLYNLFLGNAATDVSASAASGTVEALANKNGTSVFDAATGVATATAKSGSEADLKSGVYVVYAASATTVDVYAYTDVDAANGTAFTYQDDTLKITASALTITASTAVEIPNTGIELTGGSGVIGMTVGDTAVFEVVAPHNGYSHSTIGSNSQDFPEFGLLAVGQKTGDNRIITLDIFKGRASSGMSLPFNEKEFAETELVIDALYDSAKNGVYKIKQIAEAG